MTSSKQEDVVKYFKDGQHKVLIATTVAEEGLDVKKCNLVIRYEHVTNETARIQAKGRSHTNFDFCVCLLLCVVHNRVKIIMRADDCNIIFLCGLPKNLRF